MPVPSPARERVLGAAMRLFADRGFARTTVADIERAAGLSPGAGGIYRHFESKTALLEAGVAAVLTRHDEERRLRLEDPTLTLHDHLVLFARAGLVMIRAQRDLIRLLYRDLADFPDLLAEVKRRLVHRGTEEFAARLRELVGRKDVDYEAIATLYVGAVVNVGVVEALLDEPAPVDDDRFVGAFVDTLHTYLTKGRRS